MRRPSRLTSADPPESAFAALLLTVAVLSGCNGANNAPSPEGPGGAQRSATSGGDTVDPGTGASGTTVGLVRDSRTRWINDIPYDVWFDRPLDVYQDNSPLPSESSGNAVVAVPDPAPVEPAETTPEPASGTTAVAANTVGAVNWDELAPADVVTAEVKDLRVRLSANLQTVATFNRAAEPIANDSMILSALAGVVERSTHDVNWRDKARHVRDLAYQISTVQGTGREAFQKASDPFDRIVTMLDGGPPPDVEAAEKTPFADYVSRGEMMKRINSSLDWLKAEINTESRLKEHQDQVIRCATVLAVLGTVCGDEGYEFSEEPDFRGFVQEFVGANADVVKAAADQNFTEFETARGRLQNSCAACHTRFKDTGS